MQTEETLKPQLQQNIELLKQRFGNSIDLYTKPVRILGIPCCLCMFEGLSTIERLWVVVLDMLSKSEFQPESGLELFHYMQSQTDLPLENSCVETVDQLRTQLTAGTTVILIDGCCKAVVLSTQNMQFRSIQEPSGEGNVRGSREGFSDLLRINISLLRRLIRTETLTVETMICGERTATEVALVYDRSLAPEELVKQIRGRLSKAKLPVLFDSSYLVPFLQRGGFSFF